MRSPSSSRAAGDRLAKPILLLLLTLLVPSAGVLWMMREAVRNERLAAGQRLNEAYHAQLQTARTSIADQWAAELEALAANTADLPPAASFWAAVERGSADSALIYDDRGRLLYPNDVADRDAAISERLTAYVNSNPSWQRAQQLEFQEKRFAAAADAYDEAALSSDNPAARARARQAQVRCLLQMGDEQKAIDVLQAQRKQTGLFDAQGRSLVASAELRLLDLLDRETAAWQEVAAALADRLQDYRGNPLPASQRRFLLESLSQIAGDQIQLPNREAEALAAQLSEQYRAEFSAPKLQPTSLPQVWSRSSQDGRVVALYRESTIRERLFHLASVVPLPRAVSFTVASPAESSEGLLDVSLGKSLGGWRLGLKIAGDDPFLETSQHRRAVHIWIALLVVGTTCALGWLLASTLQRRLQLAQLKNDLVATVSHELKTPLASIRLLVDTLLDSEQEDRVQAGAVNTTIDQREYLQMIAKENARLTRLIDNFLTFSRIDRGKQRFKFQDLDVREAIEQAADVFRERHDAIDDCLEVTADRRLWIVGDLDALVTALVNLLENAWKFSSEPRRISMTASRDGDRILLAVSDNGVGLAPRAANRVFDSFYQVDQRVARNQGGCGLGLSIVQSIAQAHQGEVRVESEAGVGSTFTLALPVHPRLAESKSESQA